jgi:hypothetical protein
MISPIPFFLLNNKIGSKKEIKPKIESLGQYTKLSSDEFVRLLGRRLSNLGLSQAITYIDNWYGFDLLSAKQKADFVRRVETPEYYTLKARVERIFNKARKWKK